MSLQKEIIFDNGSVATYHKIVNVNITYNNYKQMLPAASNETAGSYEAKMTILSFKDKDWRTKKPNSAISSDLCVVLIESESIDNISRQLLYNKLKQLQKFTGSLDI